MKSVMSEEEHIKRPMNPFMVWCKERRGQISKENPGLHASQISGILGREWKEMTPQGNYIKLPVLLNSMTYFWQASWWVRKKEDCTIVFLIHKD